MFYTGISTIDTILNISSEYKKSSTPNKKMRTTTKAPGARYDRIYTYICSQVTGTKGTYDDFIVFLCLASYFCINFSTYMIIIHGSLS